MKKELCLWARKTDPNKANFEPTPTPAPTTEFTLSVVERVRGRLWGIGLDGPTGWGYNELRESVSVKV
jgi:hypothetical protein